MKHQALYVILATYSLSVFPKITVLYCKIMYRQFNGEKYLVCLHHTHPRDEPDKPHLHTFPEDNLSRRTKETDSIIVSLLNERLGWETRGLV